jgi:hypothetical protein
MGVVPMSALASAKVADVIKEAAQRRLISDRDRLVLYHGKKELEPSKSLREAGFYRSGFTVDLISEGLV